MRAIDSGPFLSASAGWGVALVLLLGLLATYRPQAVCIPTTSAQLAAAAENPAAVEAAVQAWQEMWEEIEARGVDAFDPGLEIAGAQYAGDTCGMRYRRLYRAVDPEARERLVIAAFANDPRWKQRALEPLLASPDEPIRARAAVEMARAALRSGEFGLAEAALEQALGLDIPEACAADVLYLRGRIALHRGEMDAALEALTVATTRDPGYWNAWRDQLPLLVHALHERPQSTSECLDHARRLIEVLGLLPQLANDVRQFGKLALLVERLGARNAATLLASGLAWQWAGQRAHGHAVLVRAMNAPRQLPVPCELEIRSRLAGVLEVA